MLKHNKVYIILMILFFQSVLSITLGLFFLHFSSKGHILPNVYVSTLYVGNYTKSKAVSAIKEHYDKISEDSGILIKCDDDKEYRIKLSDIEFSIDCEATADEAYYIKEDNRLARLIKGFFANKKITIYPVVKINEEKLKKHLEEFALLVDKAPVNARINFQNGEISKIPHQLGMKLNIPNSIEKIKSEIGNNLNSTIEFNPENNYEINWIWPELTLSDFNGIDSVISSYSTPITDFKDNKSIVQAAKALNGFLVMGSDFNNRKYKEFSFVNRMKEKGISFEKTNEGLSQVASTLYAALLKTGIDVDYIYRKKHNAIVEYIEPGLDVEISEKEGDFTFKNPFDFPIAVFTEYDDRNITVYILGSKGNGYSKKEIETRVVQKIEPPVLRTVNYDLKPLEEKVVISGKPGIEVEVYRVSEENGKINSDLLYIDSYEAVESIVQVGPKR
ncbi:VanW family protein [Acetivibrio clariflavus]|uniref:Putative vancomycin resistance protein n=1 Tax=Acetivibrio clariflavus (strain DSM 19732 / NBRC 101661 / EBR45) TaxID=720554 RepID=G8LY52_ACECE|nr:peptidoglycan binding domain-containing protein [Acetivibrio clariflavus]AEV67783.1 putative vancomycin resistance protein [Acetivibrio clariflavus DSM 19732]